MTIDLAEGWTGPVELTLEGDDDPVNLTGLTVSAQLYDRDGAVVDASGDVTVTGPSVGEIKWTPDAADLSASRSPYELRFKASAGGEDVFFPNGDPVFVRVRR